MMTLILNQSDWEELCQQAPKLQLGNLVLDDFEKLTSCPKLLGREFSRVMQLSPGVKLTLSDGKCCQDWMFKEPSHEHPVQFLICLSGFIHCDIHPNLGGTRGYSQEAGFRLLILSRVMLESI